ncbi:uncharacterized protein upd3 [Drosophila montana]|uniref:uncharacterized protein upd3 n=1 Tax=Drosophila montana TaxID=40370 RepID=UPI00313AA401
MTTTVGQLLASTASSSQNNSNNINSNNINNNNSNNDNNDKTANTRKTASTTTSAKPQLPRSSRSRRRPQYFVSVLMLAVLMCQLQQFVRPGGGGSGLAMAAPAPAPAPVPEATPATLSAILIDNVTTRSANRTRIQKRHYTSISFKERFHRELNSSILDWSNGCGGNWTGSEEDRDPVRANKRCAKHKKLLRTLQNKTGRELRQLRTDNKLRQTVHSMKAQDTGSNQAIDISEHGMWKMHSSQYNFLPRLNASGHQLALRRAHHDLQFYVAAFSYLRHAQLHWDYENLQKQSVLSAELLRYRSSARTVLCIVEEAINGSSRLYAPSPQKHQRHKKLSLHQIKTVPREPMEKRLQKFKTPLVELHRQAVLAARNQPAAEPSKPHHLDALFLKFQYMDYLKHMTQLLAKQRKRNCTSSQQQLATRPKSQQRQQQAA